MAKLTEIVNLKTDKIYVDSELNKKVDLSKTITSSVGGILSDVDAVKFDGIETGATSDQSKEDIDSLLINAKTVNSFTIETSVPSDALFTDTIQDISGKVDNSRVLTDVPSDALFTDTIQDISGKADKTNIKYLRYAILTAVDSIVTYELLNTDSSAITDDLSQEFIAQGSVYVDGKKIPHNQYSFTFVTGASTSEDRTKIVFNTAPAADLAIEIERIFI